MFKENLSEEQIKRNREWISALRSGLYKQTTDWLKNKDCYCCLGLAYELSNVGSFIKEGMRGLKDYLIFSYCGEAKKLPTEVRDYYGLKIL